MSTCSAYVFTPCCGDGHPVFLKTVDANDDLVDFGVLPHVWTYTGSLPYVGWGGYELIPEQCYVVTQTTVTLEVCLVMPPSPNISNFASTTYDTCEETIGDPKCGCPSIFQFVPCCPGSDTLLFNVTNENGLIIDGATYTVVIDITDFTTAQCFTITAVTVEDPELVPVLDISNIDISSPTTCETATCQLLCDPCLCYEISGTSGIANAITCNLIPASIRGTVSGPEIQYAGDPTWYPITKVCLRYYQEVTFGLTVSTAGDCEVIYWNAEGSEIICPTYYKIVNCDNPAEEYCVTNDLSDQYAANQVLTLVGQPEKCWRIETTQPCEQTITISFNQTHADCTECLEKVVTTYELINCNDESQILYADNSNLESFIGAYVSLSEFPDDCWYVQVANSFMPAIPITILDSFISCAECTQQYYILEDCNIDDPALPIITSTDLSAYVGQVITLATCPDICWQVSTTDNTIGSQSVVLQDSFETCQLCIQPTPLPGPVVYKYKSVKPGYNTPGCSPEKYEQYMCNFSESMYRQVMVDAYGITPCCGDDDIKWEIKYELIKLKAITDPDYNCTITNCGCTTSTQGLEACEPIPVPVTGVIYRFTVETNEGSSLTMLNCDGSAEQVVVFEPGKFPVQYFVCGVAGQIFAEPPNCSFFSYEETTDTCECN